MGKAKMGPKGGVYVITKNGNKKYLKPDNFNVRRPPKPCGSAKNKCTCGCSIK